VITHVEEREDKFGIARRQESLQVFGDQLESAAVSKAVLTVAQLHSCTCDTMRGWYMVFLPRQCFVHFLDPDLAVLCESVPLPTLTHPSYSCPEYALS
jgi:hypothetical protein